MTQTVPDISPLMPMHQDPLLGHYKIRNKILLNLNDTFSIQNIRNCLRNGDDMLIWDVKVAYTQFSSHFIAKLVWSLYVISHITLITLQLITADIYIYMFFLSVIYVCFREIYSDVPNYKNCTLLI